MKYLIAATFIAMPLAPVSAELASHEIDMFVGLPSNFYAVAGFWSGANMLCDLHGYKTHPELSILEQLKLTDWLDRISEAEYAIYKERQSAFFEVKQEQGTASACDVAQKLELLVK